MVSDHIIVTTTRVLLLHLLQRQRLTVQRHINRPYFLLIMPFGQVVVGPPGSGKTTYCAGMQQFLQQNGRDTIIINMDPANENITYPSP